MKRVTRKKLFAVTTGFINRELRFWRIKVDVANMRVTTFWGKLGLKGARKVHFFNDRESLRDFVDAITERKIAAGYVLIG